jgi:hypothetical protein
LQNAEQPNVPCHEAAPREVHETLLKQLHHECDTNNNVKGFNKFLTKFFPKDWTCCETTENKARIMLAVGPQSAGCRQFCGRVFERTGIVVDDDDMTGLFLRSEDSETLWQQLHRRTECVKTNRMRVMHEKLREGVEKLKADNAKALGCESGMIARFGFLSTPQISLTMLMISNSKTACLSFLFKIHNFHHFVQPATCSFGSYISAPTADLAGRPFLMQPLAHFTPCT